MFLSTVGCLALGYLGIKTSLILKKAYDNTKYKEKIKKELENIRLPDKDFESFYNRIESKKEKIAVITAFQKNIELEKAKKFAEEVMKLAGNDKSIIKQLITFTQNIQKQDTPLGVVGIISKKNSATNTDDSLAAYLKRQLNIDIKFDCIVKDSRVNLHQLSIFSQRLYEAYFIILNEGLPLSYERRKDLAKKITGGIMYSSVNIFEDEATYNKEILNGQYPLKTAEEIMATKEQEDCFRFGGGSFMKDELIRLRTGKDSTTFTNTEEKIIEKKIEQIKKQQERLEIDNSASTDEDDCIRMSM